MKVLDETVKVVTVVLSPYKGNYTVEIFGIDKNLTGPTTASH